MSGQARGFSSGEPSGFCSFVGEILPAGREKHQMISFSTAGIPEELQNIIRDFAPAACELSDTLGADPETSGIEYRASSMHIDLLRQGGFKTEKGICGFDTAFLGRWRRGTGRPVVTLIAEYDALPVIGHGCGHNIGGAISSLAASALAIWGKFENVEIRVLGTPAEEEGDAKVLMADRGVFSDTDIVLMIHPSPGFSTTSFRSTAYSAREIGFQYPESYRSSSGKVDTTPVEALEAFRRILLFSKNNGWPPAVVNSLGSPSSNDPPGKACLAKECFAFFSARRSFLSEFLEKAKHEADEIGAVNRLDRTWAPIGTDIAEYLRNEAAERHMKEIFQSLNVAVDEIPRIHGSADIGNVSQVCPTLHAMLDISGEELPWHSRDFALATTKKKAHEALQTGATALSTFIIDFIQLQHLREAISVAHKSSGAHLLP